MRPPYSKTSTSLRAVHGIDIFGRIVDQKWLNYTGTPTTLDEFTYGYDLDSNRQWKQNTVGTALDEYYTYDQLNRLTDMQRGTLNDSYTGITGTPVNEQNWTLDPTGNWTGFIDSVSGTADLNQGRTANTVNEITDITASEGTPVWVTPAYDAAGNTITFPQPADPTVAYNASYDAWNRMVIVTDGDDTVAAYVYDGRNRRITQTNETGT